MAHKLVNKHSSEVAGDLKMRLCEKFVSLQGEGLHLGVPSFFIRMSGCNLRCAWCDTPYASWNPEGDWVQASSFLPWLQAYPQVKHVVLTGGEPFIMPNIREWVEWFRSMGYCFTIETAGTRWVDTQADCLMVSPKLVHSTPNAQLHPVAFKMHSEQRIQYDALRMFSKNGAWFKFVVQNRDDLAEIQEILFECGHPAVRTYLMPCQLESDNLKERQVAQWALEHGMRFSPRLHVQLWGNTRGT
jgi:7-carboxy-7-deazaguanine synthase